jgi:hypothetical protein
MKLRREFACVYVFSVDKVEVAPLAWVMVDLRLDAEKSDSAGGPVRRTLHLLQINPTVVETRASSSQKPHLSWPSGLRDKAGIAAVL